MVLFRDLEKYVILIIRVYLFTIFSYSTYNFSRSFLILTYFQYLQANNFTNVIENEQL